MIKYATLFSQFLQDKKQEQFSYQDIADFNQYLIDTNVELKNKLDLIKERKEITMQILNGDLNDNQKLEKVREFLISDSNEVLFHIAEFILTRDYIKGIKFFYPYVDSMLQGEYENLIGFFYDFIFSDSIMIFARLLLDEMIYQSDFDLAIKLSKTLIVLSQRDALNVSKDLAFIFLYKKDYNELVKLYLKCQPSSSEVEFCLFIAYILSNRFEYCLSLIPNLKNSNPYLLIKFFDFDPNINLYDKLSPQALKFYESYKLYLFGDIKQEVLQKLNKEQLDNIAYEIFALSYDEIKILEQISQSQSDFINRGELFNQVIYQIFSKEKDALQSAKIFDQSIEKLIAKHYINVKKDQISLTPYGQECLSFAKDGTKVFAGKKND